MGQKESDLFRLEESISQEALDISKNKSIGHDVLIKEYEKLTHNYLKLLRQTKKLVKMSDYQQFNLNQANQELTRLTDETNRAYHELNRVYTIIKQDLSFAKRLQDSILPKRVQKFHHLNFVIKYFPMTEVGGDIYDLEAIQDEYIRLFIADATGHGVQAALITMIIKTEYENMKHIFKYPNELLGNLNKQFMNTFYSLNVFFTAAIVDIDLQRNEIHFSSAGHPNQYLIRENDLILLPISGKPLGILSDSEYSLLTLPYFKNDKLLMFSDGLYEEFNQDDEEFGEEKLIETVKKYKTENIGVIIDKTLAEVNEFRQGKAINDDITILGMQ